MITSTRARVINYELGAMQQRAIKLVAIFLVVATGLRGQNTEIDRLIKGELEMSFPSIYFKNNSTAYAAMPYTADSCFKYMATHIKDIKSFVIWRDSSETDKLVNKRIENLKVELNKYTPSGKIKIRTMGEAQKISQLTIHKSVDYTQTQYLLSLNSAFDIYTTGVLAEKNLGKKSHVYHPRIWCLNCWKAKRFSKDYRRLHVK
jgi:hypothetical protein